MLLGGRGVKPRFSREGATPLKTKVAFPTTSMNSFGGSQKRVVDFLGLMTDQCWSCLVALEEKQKVMPLALLILAVVLNWLLWF